MTLGANAIPGLRVASACIVLAALVIGVSGSGRIALPDHAEADARRAAAWTEYRIDVNSASAGELRALPGIGPALAERIVQHRETHGPFVTLDELAHVHRVGPAIVRRVRPYAEAEVDRQGH